MRYLNLSFDDAYKHVKQRRPKISPNMNFVGQLAEYERMQSSSSTEPVCCSMMKCISSETAQNERCRLVQIEGRSNNDQNCESKVKSLINRPTTTFQNSTRPKLTRPSNISLDQPRLKLINSSFNHLNDLKSTEISTKSVDKPSSLINTYVPQSNTSKSLEQWASPQTCESNVSKPKSNVLSASLELIVS